MLRSNHYELAFEAFLRGLGVPYVAVDETNRSVLAKGGTIKSLDFLVPSGADTTWLVDVKGRRFPGADRQYWKNWSTRDDLMGLSCWEKLFGESFRGLFVFAYDILGERAPLPLEELFSFRGKHYAFVAITLERYARNARPLSRAWDTVRVSTPLFRREAVPFRRLVEVVD